jgi:hypothetical protein
MRVYTRALRLSDQEREQLRCFVAGRGMGAKGHNLLPAVPTPASHGSAGNIDTAA